MIDIRRIIGGLFALYGAILTIVGLFDSAAEIDKAQGVRINLWAGIAMAVIGALVLAWSAVRPLPPPTRGGDSGETIFDEAQAEAAVEAEDNDPRTT